MLYQEQIAKSFPMKKPYDPEPFAFTGLIRTGLCASKRSSRSGPLNRK